MLKADIAYIDDRRQGISPEQSLWLAVLLKALEDMGHPDPDIRQDAIEFINGPFLPVVLERAGFDRGIAPRIRANLPPPHVRAPPVKQRYTLEYRGETHDLHQWAKILGISKWLIYRRHRQGLPTEQVLSPELSRRGRKKRQPNISDC